MNFPIKSQHLWILLLLTPLLAFHSTSEPTYEKTYNAELGITFHHLYFSDDEEYERAISGTDRTRPDEDTPCKPYGQGCSSPNPETMVVYHLR